MGPWRETRAVPPSSPGWTRTSNPSVNSRMLCQLSYRGMLRGRLYGPCIRASRFDGDCAERVFEGLYLEPEPLLVVVVGGLPFVTLAAQDNQAQDSLSHGPAGGVQVGS